MGNLRFDIIRGLSKKHAIAVESPKSLTSEFYGRNIFGRKQMSKYLSKETYKAFSKVLDQGAPDRKSVV